MWPCPFTPPWQTGERSPPTALARLNISPSIGSTRLWPSSEQSDGGNCPCPSLSPLLISSRHTNDTSEEIHLHCPRPPRSRVPRRPPRAALPANLAHPRRTIGRPFVADGELIVRNIGTTKSAIPWRHTRLDHRTNGWTSGWTRTPASPPVRVRVGKRTKIDESLLIVELNSLVRSLENGCRPPTVRRRDEGECEETFSTTRPSPTNDSTSRLLLSSEAFGRLVIFASPPPGIDLEALIRRGPSPPPVQLTD